MNTNFIHNDLQKDEYEKKIKEKEKKFSNMNTGEIGEQGSCLTNRKGKLYKNFIFSGL